MLIFKRNFWISNVFYILWKEICFFFNLRRKIVRETLPKFWAKLRHTYLTYCAQKEDLIESKKIICLKDFLWFKKIIYLNKIKFIWFKQSIFEPNQNLFKTNEFLSQIKQIIFLTKYRNNNLFILKKNLFDSNKYWLGPKTFCLNWTNVI